MADDPTPTCFIAMPVRTLPEQAALYIDDQHWQHVMEDLFEPAIRAAGFEPVRPISKGASMIHADIVRNLEECDMVLCDFTGWNVNVFFELGVRVSLDKPMAVVRDEVTDIPFDLGGVNCHVYQSGMRTWQTPGEVDKLTEHIRDSVATCGGRNPLWRQFGLTIRAEQPSTSETPLEAKLDLLLAMLRAERSPSRLERPAYFDGGFVHLEPGMHAPLSGDLESAFADVQIYLNKRKLESTVRIDEASKTLIVTLVEGPFAPADVLPQLTDRASRYGVRLKLRSLGEDG